MQFIMTEKSSRRSSTKIYSHKIIKAYLFVVLNEYFFNGNRIHCSKSEDLSFCDQNLKVSEFFTKLGEFSYEDLKKLYFENQTLANSSEQSEKSDHFSSENSSSSKSEKEIFHKKYNFYFCAIKAFKKKLREFLEKTTSNFQSSLVKNININMEIKNNIDEAKKQSMAYNNFFCKTNLPSTPKRPETQEPSFFKYTEQFYEEEITFCEKIKFKTYNMWQKAYELLGSLKSFSEELQISDKSKLFCDLNDFCKKIDGSKIFTKIEMFLKEIEEIADFVEKNIKRASLVLSIFSECNSLTVEEFEINKETKRDIIAGEDFNPSLKKRGS